MLQDNREVNLDPSWKSVIKKEFSQDYMKQLREFLMAEKKAGKCIFPKEDEYFNAMNFTPFDKVKVVILGQDPYHGPKQAHGLSFSVQPGVKIPPSLKNIYKEIEQDLGIQQPDHGCLETWAKQGVLLLNSVLTVTQGQAGAHQGKGWEMFTDNIIKKLSEQREKIVFMLWGSYAHKKGQVIDTKKHLVLKSPHPSPLSAYRGFFGCQHFSKSNQYLEAQGAEPINWELPS